MSTGAFTTIGDKSDTISRFGHIILGQYLQTWRFTHIPVGFLQEKLQNSDPGRSNRTKSENRGSQLMTSQSRDFHGENFTFSPLEGVLLLLGSSRSDSSSCNCSWGRLWAKRWVCTYVFMLMRYHYVTATSFSCNHVWVYYFGRIVVKCFFLNKKINYKQLFSFPYKTLNCFKAAAAITKIKEAILWWFLNFYRGISHEFDSCSLTHGCEISRIYHHHVFI